MAILAMTGHGREARGTRCGMATMAMTGLGRNARATSGATANGPTANH